MPATKKQPPSKAAVVTPSPAPTRTTAKTASSSKGRSAMSSAAALASPRSRAASKPTTPSSKVASSTNSPSSKVTKIAATTRAAAAPKAAKAVNLFAFIPPVATTPQKKQTKKQQALVPTTKAALTPPPTAAKSRESAASDILQEAADACVAAAVSPSAKSFFKSPVAISLRVEKMYKLIRKSTGALGGNGATGAIYGELTMGSMQKVVNIMVKQCEMSTSSRFIDVGSGLGKPNFHAAQDPAVRLSIGVELEKIRWQLAMHNLHAALPAMADSFTAADLKETKADCKLFSATNFIVGDIDEAKSTDPFTHIYMYDLGFPPWLQQSIARKFNGSCHARYLVSYRPPHRVLKEYGFEVELVTQALTSMHGSQEGHMAYFYRRTTPAPRRPRPADGKLLLPRRAWVQGERDEEVVCDPMFQGPIKSILRGVTSLAADALAITDDLQNGGRPRRERRRTARFY